MFLLSLGHPAKAVIAFSQIFRKVECLHDLKTCISQSFLVALEAEIGVEKQAVVNVLSCRLADTWPGPDEVIKYQAPPGSGTR